MKNKIYLIALVLIGGFLCACNSEEIIHQDKFETSFKSWRSFKKQSKNAYKYVVKNSSWIGLSWETTITVEDGIVIQRVFKYTEIDPSINIDQDDLEWVEEGNDIGTHNNGASPITLDEIYAEAENNWLKDRDDVIIYFETENNGMISICGYTNKQCSDDCFIGVTIKSIAKL
ncbi:hypothetical protein [Tenacibaculum sp. M341]|uniref:hypothetical protein n=1 Tax=Tenacibaculum sp. M341 TaxID=2530339 RepID=UPI00104899B5|nr:hypothetical protein [Tenacibaculum sp. M341]TCI91825.1 hypothetical protein EYW44_09740 [Tenacibaculum sp. M341]